MLKILKSVHRQPPVLKHYLCLNAIISVLLKCFRQESSYKVKIPLSPILPMKLCKCYMCFVFQTVTWNENIACYSYINTQNRVNHVVINRNCQRYLFFSWWEKWHFQLLSRCFNFVSKVMIARRKQWWMFSFVIQMRSSFFMKFISEKTRSSAVCRPKHSEDSHCWFVKREKVLDIPSFDQTLNNVLECCT